MFRSVAVGLLTIGCAGLLGCDNSPSSSAPVGTDSSGRTVAASVHNDADLLVYRCGKPDRVLDSSQDVPRPPIPSRILTYRKAHLRFAYVPSGPVGQPPPYHWKLMGVIDTRTNEAIGDSELQTVLNERLPCLLENPQ